MNIDITPNMVMICNQIYSDDKIQESSLDYNIILKKWYKSATLDYINKVKNFKLSLSKDSLSICYKNEYIKQIKNIKNHRVKEYCIPIIALPHRVIVDQFI
ncbi:hypothetical protein ACTFIT_007848 [Dictyostelium discoideum]